MNLRRALKSLETLARVRDQELSVKRRRAAELRTKLARVDKVIADLGAAMREEGAALDGDAMLVRSYAAYAANARRRIAGLAAAREALKNDIGAADAAVRNAFKALKKIEKAADARRRELVELEEKRERDAADDLAGIRAARAAL